MPASDVQRIGVAVRRHGGSPRPDLGLLHEPVPDGTDREHDGYHAESQHECRPVVPCRPGLSWPLAGAGRRDGRPVDLIVLSDQRPRVSSGDLGGGDRALEFITPLGHGPEGHVAAFLNAPLKLRHAILRISGGLFGLPPRRAQDDARLAPGPGTDPVSFLACLGDSAG